MVSGGKGRGPRVRPQEGASLALMDRHGGRDHLTGHPSGLMFGASCGRLVGRETETLGRRGPGPAKRLSFAGKFGGAKRDRTADLLHAMQALSQLSYGPVPIKNRSGMTILDV
jgi:hypothetical protein